MSTQWAVQYKSFMDGDFDRTMTSTGLGRHLYTEAEAREEYESMAGPRGMFRKYPEAIRLVTREVSDWAPMSEAVTNP